MIKTVTLTGSEVKVTDLGGQNAAVKNLGSGSIYVSTKPNITAGADNVIEIPAGAGEVVLDAHGTVYIVGTGKVQCTGTSYAVPNFKLPSSSSGGGGGTSDVTKEYVDAQDATNLSLAKAYTDNAKSEIQTTIDTVGDTLNTHIADQVKHITAEERAAWNAKADLSDIPTELPANGGNADTVNGHTVESDVPANAKFTDTKVTSVANHYTPSADSNASLSASASGATAAWGIDVVKGVTLSRDAKGHVTGVSVKSGKIPANPNTDTKVTNTLAKTTKAYVTGTTSSSTNTGTQVFDTGVYLDTTAGQLVASTFKGALSGNADTATALKTSAGAAALPVYFSGGKPVACSGIVKHNTGNLSTGDNTISYATGYKYALILLYCYKTLSSTSNLPLQPVISTWTGILSSTTSYDVRTISVSNDNAYKVELTVSNGDLIINVSGASRYRYWVMWSN